MPLQNRVTPTAELIAAAGRGLLFGNRGGRFHDAKRQLTSRRFVSRSWICCRLAFKGRHRTVWGNGYTELFFLDEVTALAAGHRPCFECRRHEAIAFASAFADPHPHQSRLKAPEMDRILHAERLEGRGKRRHRLLVDTLPDGVVLEWPGCSDEPLAVRGRWLLQWSPDGYVGTVPRPSDLQLEVLTPPSIVGVLARGYAPLWHPSADEAASRPTRP